MPDRRVHRGPHPEDERWFADAVEPLLVRATADLCWMLSRGYSSKSALKLVGDRYELVARQRTAVGRCACSDYQANLRRKRLVPVEQLAEQPLWLDGYNVLVSVEAALSGGLILIGRDGALRDMASMHGSYRKVDETRPAIELIGRTVEELSVGPCHWYLDSPVSNSGRLKKIIEEAAAERDWPWQVELVTDPDAVLSRCDEIAATADSAILDRCTRWFDLARETVSRHVPDAWVMELGAE